MKASGEMMSTYQTCKQGYRLHCEEGIFRLYDKVERNTFIYVHRPPPPSAVFVSASIALDKINARVQRVGRLFASDAYPDVFTECR
jgi:hypothetical protein